MREFGCSFRVCFFVFVLAVGAVRIVAVVLAGVVFVFRGGWCLYSWIFVKGNLVF